MATTRKRKHTSDQQSSMATASTQTTVAFGCITKPHPANVGLKKRKMAHVTEVVPALLKTASQMTDKKRKRHLSPVAEERVGSNADATGDNAVLSDNDQAPSTPRRKRTRNTEAPAPDATPSKRTAAMFGSLQLGPLCGNVDRNGHATPANATQSGEKELDSCRIGLPDELRDLTSLHSAFLTALSLYYAHNGASSPVNVDALLPTITATWRKRAVSLDDIRTLLALIGSDRRHFALRQFERSGICLVRSQQVALRPGTFVDEIALGAAFDDSLAESWRAWLASDAGQERSVAAFLSQRPRIEIEKDELTASIGSRGRQRLADFRASQTAARAETAVKAAPSDPKPAEPLQNRGINLLDRILAKQSRLASLPAGPTRAQLERKTALQRIEDIARVLDLLTAGRPRCSFGLHSLVQQLQQSLRTPIAREEVERCLELMASEITPGFISMLRSGGVSSVVVTRGGKVDLDLLRARVQRAEADI